MKLLIMSDIHRKKAKTIDIIEHHKDVDLIVSLGDSELKTAFLASYDILAIKGNFPFDAGFTYEHTMTIDNKTLLFIHGHKYKVHHGVDICYKKLANKNVDYVFYGHTHKANIDKIADVIFINPGSVAKSRNDAPESYLIARFKDTLTLLSWHDATNHALLKEIRLKE